MSLKLWLSFNGDTMNKGTSLNYELTDVGTSYSNTGKFRYSRYFNGTSALMKGIGYTLPNPCSVACWVNFSRVTSTTQWVVNLGGGGGNADCQIGFYINTSGISYVAGGSGTTYSCTLSTDTWYHIAVSWDGSTKRLYLNGSLVASSTAGSSLTRTNLCIGARTNNSAGTAYTYYTQCYMNDLRIYDHCVSLAEVRTMYLALMLHLPLNSVGGIRENVNLLNWSSDYTEASPKVRTTTSRDGYEYLANSRVRVYPNSVYFIQCRCNGVIGTHDTSGSSASNKFTLYLYIRNNGTTAGETSYDTAYNLNKNNIYYQKGDLFVWRYSTGSTAIDMGIRTNLYSNGTDEVSLKFWDFKIEKGSMWTPYSPGHLSSQFTELGYILPKNLMPSSSVSESSITVAQYYSTITTSTSFFGLRANDYYTCRVYITAPATKGIKLRIQFYTNDSTRTSIMGNTIEAGTSGYSIISSQLTSAQSGYSRMEICLYSADTSVTSSDTVKYRELKLEYGSAYSEWCPNSNTIIYGPDESGISGNGYSSTGNPAWTPDTKRYEGCLAFNNGSYLSYVPDPISEATKEFTMSVWFNTSSIANSHCIWNGRDTTGAAVALFIMNTGKLRFDVDTQLSSNATIALNTWYHVVCTYKAGGTKAIYINGALDKSTSAAAITGKRYDYATIGVSSTGGSPNGSNYMEGKLSDFRIYGTAFTAEDVKNLYGRGAAIDKSANFFTAEVDEMADKTQFARRRSRTTAAYEGFSKLRKYDPEIYIEPDNSTWVRISHHDRPSTYKFASGDDFLHGIKKNSGNTWLYSDVLNYVNKYEFLVKQAGVMDGTEQKLRWSQKANPLTATYEDVNPGNSNVTWNTSSGYTSSSYGGIYVLRTNTYFCATNGTKGNWFGAVGGWGTWNNGIPGWNSTAITTGYLDLYLRIDNVIFSGMNASIASDDSSITINSLNEV